MNKRLASIIAVLSLFAAAIASAQFERYVVPGNPGAASPFTNWATAAASVGAALDAANAAPAGDTIWITNGIYELGVTLVITNQVYVRGFSGDPADVIIDGSNSVRCFHLKYPGIVLSGLTITNGATTGADIGAAVYAERAAASGNISMTISNCVITGNTSDDGGAIHSLLGGGAPGQNGYLYLYNTRVIGNDAPRAVDNVGGSTRSWLYFYDCHIGENLQSVIRANDGNLWMTNTVIFNNGRDGAVHYAIASSSTAAVEIYNSAITNNTGTALSKGGTGNTWTRISDSIIADNTRGIYISSVQGYSYISNSIVRNNIGTTWTGGVYIKLTTANNFDLVNTLIENNSTDVDGGGLRVVSGVGSGVLTVKNCTIAGNHTTGDAGGIWIDYDDVEFYNTIIYGNTSGGSDPNIKIMNDRTVSFNNSCSPTLPTENGNITDDPVFIGSALSNYRLRGNSPCVGTGDVLDWTVNDVDLDGNLRLFRGAIDMGCYQHRYVRGTIFQVDGLTP